MSSRVRVLFLGPSSSPLVRGLRSRGESVTATTDPLSLGQVKEHRCDAIVSYGYRHIVTPAVLAACPGRAINLHIALLPYNRGVSPNLWSFIDDTPKGVTIHYMDEGVDTGAILAQRSVRFDDETATLAETYAVLQREIQALFWEHWPAFREGRAPRIPQPAGGTRHRTSDLQSVFPRLPAGWDTSIGWIAAHRDELRSLATGS